MILNSFYLPVRANDRAVDHPILAIAARRQRPDIRLRTKYAMADAREKIRALIADGEIAQDQITAGWIERWTADAMAG